MFFRSIHFLIGVLILLFVLTTLGFSGTAFANQCDVMFDQDIPDYSLFQHEESQTGESEFINSNSGSFTESQSNGFNENYDEFGRPPSNEFDNNNSF